MRSYIAEPDRGRRKWADEQEEQAAVYANRQRIGGHRGKQLLRRRGEQVARTFAHAYETGALRRLYVCGKQNVQKKLLLQAAACNLALLLRKMIGAGTPRAMQDAAAHLFLVLLRLISAMIALKIDRHAHSRLSYRVECRIATGARNGNPLAAKARFRHGLLARVLTFAHEIQASERLTERKLGESRPFLGQSDLR